MHELPERTQELLAAVADPSRHRILREVFRGAKHVSHLAEVLGLSQSCMTRHLQCLQAAGLIRCERAGKRVMACAEPRDADAQALLEWLGWDSKGDLAADASERVPAARAAARAPRMRARNRVAAAKPTASARRKSRPKAAPAAGAQERAHATMPASDTPRATPAGRPPSSPAIRESLEDFLL